MLIVNMVYYVLSDRGYIYNTHEYIYIYISIQFASIYNIYIIVKLLDC